MTPLWKQKQDSVSECAKLAVEIYKSMHKNEREEFVHGLAIHLASLLSTTACRDWQSILTARWGKQTRQRKPSSRARG